MRYSNYPFTLDVHKTLSQVSIPVTLGDTARQLFISLTDGGKPYLIPDGCRATLSARKSDGTSLLHDCIIEKNTTIRYDFTEQTASAEGMVKCQILLYGKNGRLIASPRFTMVVYADIVGFDVLSETDLQSIGRMLAAEQERVAAENARVEAEQGRVEAENAREGRLSALEEAIPDVTDEDDGKIAQVVGGKWGAVEFDPNAKIFNLAEMGMPAIGVDGNLVMLSTDTTEMMAALDKGVVIFIVDIKQESATVRHEVAMCKDRDSVSCNCFYYIGGGMYLGLSFLSTGVFGVIQTIKDGANGKDGVNGTTPHIGANGNWFIGDEDTGIKAVGVAVDTTLTAEGEAADAAVVGTKFTDVIARLEELEYVPIKINSFSSNYGNVEIGRALSDVVLNWTLNKEDIKSQYIDATDENGLSFSTGIGSVPLSAREYKFSGVFSSYMKFVLTVRDGKNTATAETAINFLNGVYYGAAAVPSEYNSAFILGLTKKLASGRSGAVNVTAGDGKYIYYCYPSRFGAATFVVGGFTGGFELVDTISFTNASGYTENYYICKSEQAGLGALKVEVS